MPLERDEGFGISEKELCFFAKDAVVFYRLPFTVFKQCTATLHKVLRGFDAIQILSLNHT